MKLAKTRISVLKSSDNTPEVAMGLQQRQGRNFVRTNGSIILLMVLAVYTAYAQYLPPGTWKHLPSQSVPSGTITVQNYLRGISMVGDEWGVASRRDLGHTS